MNDIELTSICFYNSNYVEKNNKKNCRLPK